MIYSHFQNILSAYTSNADMIQPALTPLQPNLDDFMDIPGTVSIFLTVCVCVCVCVFVYACVVSLVCLYFCYIFYLLQHVTHNVCFLLFICIMDF